MRERIPRLSREKVELELKPTSVNAQLNRLLHSPQLQRDTRESAEKLAREQADELERKRRLAEEKARAELRKKVEEENLYLAHAEQLQRPHTPHPQTRYNVDESLRTRLQKLFKKS